MQVADVVGGYTAGGIANLDQSNPRIKARGMRVFVGVRLIIQPEFVVCILLNNSPLPFIIRPIR